MANFHVDSSGNLWLGDTSTTFTTSAPFYVTSAGAINATSGTFGGITIDSSGIEANYSAGSTGFRIESDGDAFFNKVDIRIGGAVSQNPSTGFTTLDIGSAKISEYDDRLWINAHEVMVFDGDATASATNPSLHLFGTYAQPGWYVDDSQVNRTKLNYTSGSDVAFHTESDRQGLFIDGAIYFGNDSGSAGEFIGKDSNGTIGWHSVSSGTTGINAGTGIAIDNTNDAISVVYGNTTNTSSRGDHNHNNFLTSNHENASDPHSVYVQNANHSHSNFIENADLSNYVTNSNTNFLSAVGHTAMAAGNAGTAHGLDLGNVLNSSSSGGGTHHSHGNIHNHSGTVLTTAGADNLYATPHNNHSHNHNQYGSGNSNWGSSDTDNNSKVSTAYSHSQSAHNNHSHSGTVLTTAGADNLYSTPHNSHSHNHNAYVTNSTYGSHLDNLHFSDERLKYNISDTSFGLAYIDSLRPVDYEFTDNTLDTYYDDPIHTNMRAKFEGIRHGFIAQEVRTATVTNHSSENAFGGLGYKTPTDIDTIENIQTFDNEQLVGPMVKAIQELSAKINLLEDRVAELEGV